MPHFRSAVCQVCGVPGPPTEVPLTRASWNAYGSPVAGLMNASTSHARRRGLPAVDGVHRPGTGVVEHEEAATAETGRGTARSCPLACIENAIRRGWGGGGLLRHGASQC